MTIESLQIRLLITTRRLNGWIEILSREPETQTEKVLMKYIEFESGKKACQWCTENEIFMPGKKNPTRNFQPPDIYSLINDGKRNDCRPELQKLAQEVFNYQTVPYQ